MANSDSDSQNRELLLPLVFTQKLKSKLLAQKSSFHSSYRFFILHHVLVYLTLWYLTRVQVCAEVCCSNCGTDGKYYLDCDSSANNLWLVIEMKLFTTCIQRQRQVSIHLLVKESGHCFNSLSWWINFTTGWWVALLCSPHTGPADNLLVRIVVDRGDKVLIC